MSPDIAKLIESADLLAERMSLPKPDPISVRAKINEILYERGHLESLAQGISSIEELALLLLAHFQTLICNLAGVSQIDATYEFQDIHKAIEHAILQASA
ncbi:hypothetical protein L2750_22745 [Shewanella submarina]|uniref:Transcriptional regulator n=1 Tax=Shewanella submarina TaxID=2016376 RepID=A0ABV7GCP2_9GAMM|nr:hypothetical protein [Shewanella submarina]MCL1039922.1 hypothetical protein [Shewanella submarina]